MNKHLLVCLLATVLPNHEALADSFGAAGQISVQSGAGLSLWRYSPGPLDAETSERTMIYLQPAADYFVMDQMSVGALLGYGRYALTDFDTVTTWGAGVRIGYHLSMSRRWSLWPRAGVRVAVQRRLDRNEIATRPSLWIPVLFHPGDNFFLGVGPMYGEENHSSLLGSLHQLRSIIGGYF